MLVNTFSLVNQFDVVSGFQAAWVQFNASSGIMKKNVASQSVSAQMITASDGSDFTGTVTVLITIDNGTQSASGGTAPAHEGNGLHSYTPTQTETNGDQLAFTFTGSGAITQTKTIYTGFPQTVDNDTKLITLLGRIIGTLATGTHNPASAAEIATLSDWIDGGRLDLIQDIIAADTTTDIPALIANLKDFDPANDAVAVVTLVNTLTTYTLNTPQTADNDILLNEIAGFIDTEITDIINTLGVAGAGLTDLGGMSAVMKGEVNAECDQALTDYDAATGTEISELKDISAEDVLAAGDVDGFSLENALKLILSALVGVLAGAATSSITIQAADGSKTRITATVDEDGNRSAVVKDVTG